MEYKYTYDNIVEREKIINDNDFLYILKDERLIDGNHITFTDNKPLPLKETEIEVLENKISILEAENKALREELEQVKASLVYVIPEKK